MASGHQDHWEVDARVVTFIPLIVVVAAVIEDGGDSVTHAVP